MFFDRHNQKNSSEKEASGDITCTSCFGNNNRCGCDCSCSGQGATGPRGATAPSIYAQHGKCRNHAAFHYLKDN